jgi:hypothetical protein
MSTLNHQQLASCAQKLINYHREAEQRNEWTFYVDELYSKNCIYTCEYAGSMLVIADGIDEIKATHYGRDMQRGWEGWSFPYAGVYVGEDNRVITHWLNRGPGKRKDGSYFETPGVSFITFNSDGKICQQLDMFDLAHQMKLCDELEAAQLLSPELKQNWVVPMKNRLIEQLKQSL